MKINLNTSEYDKLFVSAPIYAKKGTICAIEITEEGLKNDLYADKDVRYDVERGEYVIDTYVMREIPRSDGQPGCLRTVQLEDTRRVVAGEWIATNPKVYASDHDNNYAIPAATFVKRYESTTEAGVFRAKGMARIIRNNTSTDVEIEAPWGGPQTGDANCYFCAPYDRAHPNDLALGERYILSDNDFAAYGLAEEVLGGNWQQ